VEERGIRRISHETDDAEGLTIERLHRGIGEAVLRLSGKHHEIYL
jgi:hypothetical protein